MLSSVRSPAVARGTVICEEYIGTSWGLVTIAQLSYTGYWERFWLQ